jgi:hypothetical protein
MTKQSGDSPLRPWFGPKLIDSDGCIATDLPCSGCEYNLQTLPAFGRCPECGRPIGETLRSLDLRWAPIRWVSGLEFGIICILMAHAWLVISLVVVLILGGGGASGLPLLVLFLMAVGGVLTLTGTTFLSRPDPRTRRRGKRKAMRQCLRYGPVLALVAIVAQFWVVAQITPTQTFFHHLLPLIAAVFFGAVVSLPALYGHMEYLMSAAKDSHLADSTKALARVFLVLGVVTLAGVLTIALTPPPLSNYVGPALVCVALPVGLGYLLSSVAGMSVLYECAKVIAKVAAEIKDRGGDEERTAKRIDNS